MATVAALNECRRILISRLQSAYNSEFAFYFVFSESGGLILINSNPNSCMESMW
jgi:hypothetical protein